MQSMRCKVLSNVRIQLSLRSLITLSRIRIYIILISRDHETETKGCEEWKVAFRGNRFNAIRSSLIPVKLRECDTNPAIGPEENDMVRCVSSYFK